MAQALRAPVPLSDYLDAEERSDVRHEYVGGEVHAMTGGTLRHNRIAGNVYRALAARLDGTPCLVFMSDVKLHVQATDSVYYPDVLVHCGGGPAGDAKLLHDAALVVEVVSESTAGIDRREKLVAYRKLPALRAYWVVAQDEQRIEVHQRGADGRWSATAYGRGEVLPEPLPGAGTLALAAVYAGTDLA